MPQKLLVILFGLLLLAPITGELWRLPVAGFEFLPSDLLIPVIFVVWVVYKVKHDRKLRFGKIEKMIVIFLFALVITYFINLYRFNWKQMVIAFSYLGRFGMYLILPILAFDVLQNDKKNRFRNLMLILMIVSMVVISILGFLQLKYFPSFFELGMQLKGWDPHIGRLLSTWFDPNFIGGFLAFTLGLIISLGLYYRHKGNKKMSYLMIVIVLIGLFALYATYSRSGYLALIVTLGFLALLKSRKLLVAGILICFLAFSFSPRVQQRTMEAWDSGKSLLGLDSQSPLDPTAEARVWSWSFAKEMILDNPWQGIGFSRYAYEIQERGHGFLNDHNSGGSDSSLLTIWATSGIFGLLSYLAIGFVAAMVAIRRLWKKSDFQSYVDAGFVAGFGGVMAHSVFVNSLLFPLMMVYLLVGLGLLDEK